jgi:hypothetical protein
MLLLLVGGEIAVAVALAYRMVAHNRRQKRRIREIEEYWRRTRIGGDR